MRVRAQLGGAEWLELSHPSPPPSEACARDGTHLLAKRREAVANLFREQLRLFPGREVAALVELVVVDEVGICLLGPTPRHLIEIVRKDAHGYGHGDALRVEEAKRVLSVETS